VNDLFAFMLMVVCGAGAAGVLGLCRGLRPRDDGPGRGEGAEAPRGAGKEFDEGRKDART